MPRTTFVDGVTRLLSTWLNKVDATVVDGLGEQETPEGVRAFIGAASAEQLALHVGDTGDPHNTQDYLLGGYRIQVVASASEAIDAGTIYLVIP